MIQSVTMINCSCCNKPINRLVFCSNACKVRFHRSVAKPIVTTPLPPVTKPSIEDLKTIPGVTTASNAVTTADKLPSEPRQTRETIWGNSRLYCQICRTSPAESMNYKYEDGSGEGEGIFCRRHTKEYEDKSQIKNAASYAFRPTTPANMTYFNPIPKPEKKKKKPKW